MFEPKETKTEKTVKEYTDLLGDKKTDAKTVTEVNEKTTKTGKV